MPTYEYICSKCGHSFETVQSIKAKPLGICPKELCAKKTWGKGKVKRAVGGGGGLIFKGSGFYITDYRSDKYKAAAKQDAGGSSSSDSVKKDAKPAASTGSSPTSTTPSTSSSSSSSSSSTSTPKKD